MIVNLNTGIPFKGRVIKERKFIFYEYIKSYLILDIISLTSLIYFSIELDKNIYFVFPYLVRQIALIEMVRKLE